MLILVDVIILLCLCQIMMLTEVDVLSFKLMVSLVEGGGICIVEEMDNCLQQPRHA